MQDFLPTALWAAEEITRRQAAMELAYCGEPWCVGPLLHVLDLDREGTREALVALQANTLRALRTLGDSLAIEFLCASLSNPALLQLRAGGPLPKLIVKAFSELGYSERSARLACTYLKEYGIHRVWAVVVLGEIGDDQAVAPLGKVLFAGDYPTRFEAVKALGRIGSPMASLPLTEVLLTSDEDVALRREAGLALGKTGGPEAVSALCKALGDEHWHVIWAATEALRSLKDPSAIEPLCDVLYLYEGQRRPFVATALGEFGGTTAVAALCEAVADTDADTAEAAIIALGDNRNCDGIAALEWVLGQSPRKRTRLAALGALGTMGVRAALPPLIHVARDESEYDWARCAAVRALGATGVPDAGALLSEILEREQPAVATEAAKALAEGGYSQALHSICEAAIKRGDLPLDEVGEILCRFPAAHVAGALRPLLSGLDIETIHALANTWRSLPYMESAEPLQSLLQHQDARVRRWAETAYRCLLEAEAVHG